MYKKNIITIIVFLFAFCFCCFAQEEIESDQQITDFNLSGYSQQGKKSWDVKGKTADFLDEKVNLSDIDANSYKDKDTINLVADKGVFDKAEGKLHLQENVVITTDSGARLVTDSLDWSQSEDLIDTQDKVNIEHPAFNADGKGLKANPSLDKASLLKDVEVTLKDEDSNQESIQEESDERTVITCDGPLEVDYEKGMAIFYENVKASNSVQGDIYCDELFTFFKSNKTADESNDSLSDKGGKIDKIVAKGNVKIVKGENITFSDEAVYDVVQKKIILTGTPKLFIYSDEME
ncbi:MAG: LPS export ABC transporter periplasmic protein LptC [Candidatus Gygaella obscura]|nr:LPS export ABC transporter periplasmic protein LptC [Candidatus Gygaella obscura]